MTTRKKITLEYDGGVENSDGFKCKGNSIQVLEGEIQHIMANQEDGNLGHSRSQ